MENVIHHCLEGGRAISESEEHDERFKESAVGPKSSLPFISGLNANIVEAPADIQLSEVLCTMEL
jgi:hypothetical protein